MTLKFTIYYPRELEKKKKKKPRVSALVSPGCNRVRGTRRQGEIDAMKREPLGYFILLSNLILWLDSEWLYKFEDNCKIDHSSDSFPPNAVQVGLSHFPPVLI